MAAAKKTKSAGAALQGAIDKGLAASAKSLEHRRWDESTFTDDELTVVLASITRQPPARKAPTDLREKTIAAAVKAGVSVADAKAILRKAMTPSGATASKPSPDPKPRTPTSPGGGKRPVQPAAPKKKAAKLTSVEGGLSKRELVLKMITGAGATITAIMEKTGWQAHSVRGAIATFQTQDGHSIESFKNDKGERTYRLLIPAGPKAKASAPAKPVAAAAARMPTKRAVAKKPAKRK